MNNQDNHTLFRPDIVQRYRQGQETAVLPRFVAPSIFRYLWIVIALLLFGGAATWFVMIPEYVTGTAVFIHPPAAQDENPILLVFLDPEQLSQLAVGQSLSIQLQQEGIQVSWPVTAVQPDVLSPATVRQQFQLGQDLGWIVAQPTAVAIVQPSASDTPYPLESYLGSIYHVNIETGARRLATLLPLIGPWLGTEIK